MLYGDDVPPNYRVVDPRTGEVLHEGVRDPSVGAGRQAQHLARRVDPRRRRGAAGVHLLLIGMLTGSDRPREARSSPEGDFARTTRSAVPRLDRSAPPARRAGWSSAAKTGTSPRRINPIWPQGMATTERSSCGKNAPTRLSPSTMPVNAPIRRPVIETKLDSITNDRPTISLWKPIARSIPICCRRSITARTEITPRAAMPTSRPKAIKPWSG